MRWYRLDEWGPPGVWATAVRDRRSWRYEVRKTTGTWWAWTAATWSSGQWVVVRSGSAPLKRLAKAQASAGG